MTIQGVPLYIDGGAIHDAGLGRAHIHETTKGGNGVGSATDFKVTPTPVPGENVRLAIGLAFAVSRYPGVFRETYMARADSVTDFRIPATGSAGGATRWLVLRVDDPQFPGVAAPASIEHGPYVRPYLETTDPGWKGEKLPYPNVLLAKITQPANTATITADMIQDLRTIANPKQFGDTLVIYPTGSRTGGHQVPTAGYASWPITSAQRPGLDVPEWATTLTVTADFSGLYFTDTAANKPDTVAGIRSGFGVNGAENGIMIENDPGTRGHYKLVGSHPVLPEQRATRQLLNLQGVRTAGTGLWYADYQSSIAIEYLFTERPV